MRGFQHGPSSRDAGRAHPGARPRTGERAGQPHDRRWLRRQRGDGPRRDDAPRLGQPRLQRARARRLLPDPARPRGLCGRHDQDLQQPVLLRGRDLLGELREHRPAEGADLTVRRRDRHDARQLRRRPARRRGRAGHEHHLAVDRQRRNVRRRHAVLAPGVLVVGQPALSSHGRRRSSTSSSDGSCRSSASRTTRRLGDPTYRGGVFVQGAPLGITQTYLARPADRRHRHAQPQRRRPAPHDRPARPGRLRRGLGRPGQEDRAAPVRPSRGHQPDRDQRRVALDDARGPQRGQHRRAASGDRPARDVLDVPAHGEPRLAARDRLVHPAPGGLDARPGPQAARPRPLRGRGQRLQLRTTSTPSAAAGPTSSRTRPTGGCTSCGRCRAPPSAGTTCST